MFLQKTLGWMLDFLRRIERHVRGSYQHFIPVAEVQFPAKQRFQAFVFTNLRLLEPRSRLKTSM